MNMRDLFGQTALSRRALLQGASAAGLLRPVSAHAEPAVAPKRGGTLTLLVDPEPSVLVSLATSAGAENKISPKATEGLLAYDFDLNPRPQLAERWSISEDGLEYTFNLRGGVRWHDGKDFTSADVATSILLLKEYHPRGRGTFANVTDIRTPDAQTAVIVLSKPAPYLIYALAAAESPIVPRHLYDGVDPQSNPANLAPIGTGPYRFKEWQKGNFIRYERNPDYWDQPKPYVDTLIVRILRDAAARATALETGELDLAGENPVPLTDIARLTALPHLAAETRGYSYSAAQTQLEFNLDNPYLKSLQVRQAIAHAIDRQVIVDTVWYGYAIVAPSPISPLLSRFYADDVETYPFDPAASNRLLDEAGYPRGAGGTRFNLTIDPNPYNPGGLRLASYVKQALARVGISVTVRSQDFAAFVKRVYADRDFDIDCNHLSNTFDPTVGVQRVYWSKNFKKGLPFSNGSHYDNPEVDRLLEAAAIESDPAKRIGEWKQFQRIVTRDIPLINLVTLRQVTIFNKRVHDHTVTADGLNGNLADVSIADI
jgi:peptide/nickel transport system substrate-binding protein